MKKMLNAVMFISLLFSASSAFAYYTPKGADITPSGLQFEGATSDASETSLTVEEPTADRTVSIFDRDSMVPIVTTVALLPTAATANKGLIAVVTDATGATDCTSGGSNNVNVCFSGGGAGGVNWSNLA